MTRLHWVGAALVFLGSTAAGFALRQELRLRLRQPLPGSYDEKSS